VLSTIKGVIVLLLSVPCTHALKKKKSHVKANIREHSAVPVSYNPTNEVLFATVRSSAVILDRQPEQVRFCMVLVADHFFQRLHAVDDGISVMAPA